MAQGFEFEDFERLSKYKMFSYYCFLEVIYKSKTVAKFSGYLGSTGGWSQGTENLVM